MTCADHFRYRNIYKKANFSEMTKRKSAEVGEFSEFTNGEIDFSDMPPICGSDINLNTKVEVPQKNSGKPVQSLILNVVTESENVNGTKTTADANSLLLDMRLILPGYTLVPHKILKKTVGTKKVFLVFMRARNILTIYGVFNSEDEAENASRKITIKVIESHINLCLASYFSAEEYEKNENMPISPSIKRLREFCDTYMVLIEKDDDCDVAYELSHEVKNLSEVYKKAMEIEEREQKKDCNCDCREIIVHETVYWDL